MKFSYNWLKWYIPEIPTPGKLRDILTYHLCEVESVEEKEDGNIIVDVNILPNRAHDLLSHQGMARELASLLDIKFADPVPKYKIPKSKPTGLQIEIKSDKCRRYMGRIIRNVKVGPSPEWVARHLESVGQRSINNLVDAANLLMYDLGQPAHVFDLDRLDLGLVIRQAGAGERMTTLDARELEFSAEDLMVADFSGTPLGLAGIKGGKRAEVGPDTRSIVIEVANFDPVSVRRSGVRHGISTDARKRFENDLSPELAQSGMMELSALIAWMCPEAEFEDVVDVYPQKQDIRKLSFSAGKISKILGLEISDKEIEEILRRYNFQYIKIGKRLDLREVFEITVPPLRLDLNIEEDMAEEIGRVLGYDKVKGKIPKIDFKPKPNDTYVKISRAREKLLSEGYSEVMTYVFRDRGEVEVLASASGKTHLRSKLSDGLLESIKLNKSNEPLLDMETKVFEIGTVFLTDREEVHVAHGDRRGISETSLDDFCKVVSSEFQLEPRAYSPAPVFKMWSSYPFIVRDIALWVSEGVSSESVAETIRKNMGDLVVRGPELFDSFAQPASPAGGDGKISYAFRLVFQSYERTLTDLEVNGVMEKIKTGLERNPGWTVR